MGEQSKPRDARSRVVLDAVPRVGFYGETRRHDDSRMRCPEDVPFPSCLRACLEFLGDGLGCKQMGLCRPVWKLGCGYAYLMGTTGAAFRLSWKPGWHPDNVASWLVSDDPSEIFRRGFASAGRDVEILCGGELRKQSLDVGEIFRDRIIESIRDQRRPVIAHGVVGPPEECIVTGYDENGDVLIGWSFFQHDDQFNAGVEFEPSGMFRKRGWRKDTWSVLLIGERRRPPDLRGVCLDALAWALDVVHSPVRGGDRHNGLAAYDAWAEHLLRDEDFATDDLAVLNERFTAHDDAVGTVAEGRWYASLFLAEAVGRLPYQMAADLLAAASCCAAEHELMWRVWGCVGGIGHGEARTRKLAEPDVRRRIVPILREARDKDAQAADHIERALAGRTR
jgi:hypothetical protein